MFGFFEVGELVCKGQYFNLLEVAVGLILSLLSNLMPVLVFGKYFPPHNVVMVELEQLVLDYLWSPMMLSSVLLWQFLDELVDKLSATPFFLIVVDFICFFKSRGLGAGGSGLQDLQLNGTVITIELRRASFLR